MIEPQSDGAARSPSASIKESLSDGAPGDDGAGSVGDGTLSARALFGLLRVSALVTGAGWWHMLHTVAMFTLFTAGAAFTAGVFAAGGIAALRVENGRMIDALAMTGFFGMMYVLMWMTVVGCFVVSRRRYGRQLMALSRSVSRLAELSGKSELPARLRANVAWLFGAIVILIILTFSITSYYNAGNCPTLSSSCMLIIGYILAFSWFCIAFYLVPLKYVLAALYMQSGSEEINGHLRALAAGRYQPDPAAVSRLMSLQDQLSRTFARLTKTMSSELVLVIANGTVASVAMWLLAIVSLRMGTFYHMILMICFFLLVSAVTMVLPGEAVQRCLEAAGDSRDLLLAAELRQPQLGQQLSLFREVIGRDLDKLGDLGMFRLQRSTTLSITATVLTYIIVMVQFYVAT